MGCNLGVRNYILKAFPDDSNVQQNLGAILLDGVWTTVCNETEVTQTLICPSLVLDVPMGCTDL